MNLLYCSEEYESQVIGHNMPQTATALASWVKAIQKA
ncbi:AraC family transcriptional regulator, partial [Acinetobacter baumannii]